MQKRKLTDDFETEKDNKKPHNEFDFTRNEITAESTHVEGSDSSLEVEEIIVSKLSNLTDTHLEEDSRNESLLETVVNKVDTVLVNGETDVETIISLKKELEAKTKEIETLKTLNSDLTKKVLKLDSDKAVLTVDNNAKDEKI